MTVAIWWARRDLRLADNQALHAALDHAPQTIPLFILDPELLTAPDVSDKRVAFLFDGLCALDVALRARGSRLIMREGKPLAELRALLSETGATGIFSEADPWPYGRKRDAEIAAELPLHLTEGLTVHPLDAVRKASDGRPYAVFTPFGRAWRALPQPQHHDILPAPDQLFTPPDIRSLAIPQSPPMAAAAPFPSGEIEAKRRLDAFTTSQNAAVGRYADLRNRVDLDGTSLLSPYLRFGMLSARQAVVAGHTVAGHTAAGQTVAGQTVAGHTAAAIADPQRRAGAETWLTELIWREFYMTILHHYPSVLEQAFRSNLRNVQWANDEADFAAWCAGRTGYPVVDAAMRQLASTGWMHNRARMIVASFLVKDLLIDWRWGERFFMQHLVDGDPAANNGGWQWTAGVGADAAPYFRIFNPTTQGKKFDPNGQYVRRWINELAGVPNSFVHEPWRMPADIQRAAGCIVGQDYPAPIVDHVWARERTLATYRRPDYL